MVRPARCRDLPQGSRRFIACSWRPAFNDERGAEKELTALTRSGASPEQLTSVHDTLYHLYYRDGHYHKAIMEMQRTAALAPNWAPSEAEKAHAAALDQFPDLEV